MYTQRAAGPNMANASPALYIKYFSSRCPKLNHERLLTPALPSTAKRVQPAENGTATTVNIANQKKLNAECALSATSSPPITWEAAVITSGTVAKRANCPR